MGNPPAGNVVGRRIVPLPVFSQDSRLPWPSFGVTMQARKGISAGQTPFIYELSTLPPTTITRPGTNPPRPLVPQPAPPTTPKGAIRTSGAIRTMPPQTPPGGQILGPNGQIIPPRAMPAQPAQPAQTGFGTPAQPTQPKRTAGPQAPGAAPAAPQYLPQPPARPAAARVAAVPVSAGPSAAGLARAAYVLGWLTVLLNLLAGIPAIICGHMALQRANQSGTPAAIRLTARRGLVLGYTLSFLWLALIILVIIVAHSHA